MDLWPIVSCYASEVRERLSIYIQYASGQEANFSSPFQSFVQS